MAAAVADVAYRNMKKYEEKKKKRANRTVTALDFASF